MYIGIDLGGTNIKVGLVDSEGNILEKASIPTNATSTSEDIIKDMATLALQVIEQAGFTVNDVKSIGIGSPGTPDCENGMLIYTNNLPFRNTPIRAEIQKYINLPVHLNNDANCAALGEAYAGAAKDVHHSVTITLGTGVGGGVIIDKKIYAGFNHAASELGHIVIQMDGEPCTCGRNGCFESYASATALIRQTKLAMAQFPKSRMHQWVAENGGVVDGKTSFEVAKMGDSAAQEVVSHYIRYLGEGLSNVVNAFMPEILILGGGVCNQGDYLLLPLIDFITHHTYARTKHRTEIKIATLGNDAGIIGAAMLGV